MPETPPVITPFQSAAPAGAGRTASPMFASTRWSMVCAAAAHVDPRGKAALASLCESYWYPLYAFVRRRGHSADDAADLTQAFFAQLLEKNYLADADRTRGRFRNFLLASLKHFLSNEADRAARLKRGGGRTIVSLDAGDADTRYHLEPAHDLTPERLFDRRWALLLLDQVLEQVRADYTGTGRGALFEALKDALTFAPDADSCATLARTTGLSEGAVRIAVHRLRKRYRQRLRDAVADCVASEAEIDQELRELLAAVAPA